MANSRLDLNELCNGMPGITSEIGATLVQAAGVCFRDQQHSFGVKMTVGGLGQTVKAYWPNPTTQALRAWNDEQVTTEHGACGVAVLLIKTFTQYTVVERSRKGTGFDYWLGRQEDDMVPPFENKARLEVSGIRKGTVTQVKQRVQTKLKQTTPTDGGGLHAYIVVVEFGTPQAEVVQK